MKRWLQWLYFILILIAIPGILMAGGMLPIEKKTLIEEKYSGWSGVIRIWLDEDESGLAGWLNQCAAKFEKQHNGVYIQVEPVSDFSGLEAEGVRPPELALFTPGTAVNYDLFAELPRMPVRDTLQMTNIAVPLATGGYAWAINRDLLDRIPEDCSSIDLSLPMDTANSSYSSALLALSTGVAPDAVEPVLPGVDLGLNGAASATEAPAPEMVSCQLPSDLTAATDAFSRFQNGEVAATVVGPEEIVRLENLSAQGRGPDWTLEVTGTLAFTDRILLGAALESGDDREALAVEFLQFLLGDDCQSMLGKYNRFSVTDAPTELTRTDPLTVIEASLRSSRLTVPPAFFDEWRTEAPAALRAVIAGQTDAETALEMLFG